MKDIKEEAVLITVIKADDGGFMVQCGEHKRTPQGVQNLLDIIEELLLGYFGKGTRTVKPLDN